MSVPKGIAFPIRFGAHGHLRRASGLDKIKKNLRAIALTALKERPMEPDLGTLGPAAIFRPSASTLSDNFRARLLQQISAGEPRVMVEGIRITDEEGGLAGGVVSVTVSFRVKTTGQPDTLTVTG